MEHNQSQALQARCISFLTGVLSLLLVVLCSCAQPTQTTQSTTKSDSSTTSKIIHGDKDQKAAEFVTSGYVNLASNNPTMAKMFFLRAIEQAPGSIEAHIGLGDVDYQEGSFKNAFVSYSKATDIDPNNIRALVGKAQSLRQQSKLNAAIREINIAMSTAPNDIRVLTELAIIYDMLGKEALSAPLYEEILAKTPDKAASNNNLGLSFLAQKQYDRAIIAFQRALSLDSQDHKIKNNLATAFILYGEEHIGLRLFTETVGEAAAYNNLGYLYMTQGRLDDAESALHKAMDLNPKYYEKAQLNLDRVNRLRHTSNK